MTISSLDGQSDRLPIYQLQILRFNDGESKLVWMLSERIQGIYVHWIGNKRNGRNQYCVWRGGLSSGLAQG